MKTKMDPRIAERRAKVAEGNIRRGLVRLLVVLGVVALGAITVWVLRSPMFQVAEVEVRGASRSDAGALARQAGAAEGVPLITVDAEQVEAALEEDPWIRSATVSRRWPDSVVVEVSERRPAAWVRTGDGWVQASVDGTVLIRGGTPPSAAPRIEMPGIGSGRIADDPSTVGALEFLAELPNDLAARTVVTRRGDELQAQLDGMTIRLGRPVQMAQKARALVGLLGTDPEPGSEITLITPARPAVLPPDAQTTTTTEVEETSEAEEEEDAP